jgi:hypothetical protein
VCVCVLCVVKCQVAISKFSCGFGCAFIRTVVALRSLRFSVVLGQCLYREGFEFFSHLARTGIVINRHWCCQRTAMLAYEGLKLLRKCIICNCSMCIYTLKLNTDANPFGSLIFKLTQQYQVVSVESTVPVVRYRYTMSGCLTK